MDYVDTEGFVQLIKKPTEHPKETKSKKEKKPKNPFKKGSWKAWLYKKLKKWFPGRSIKEFHNTTQENIIIYRKSKPKVILSRKKFSDEDLDKLVAKYQDDCYVLINAGDNTFIKISLKSYIKLIKVDKMIVSMKLQAFDDAAHEIDDRNGPYELYDNDTMIGSVNEFMSFLNYVRQLINGVFDIQAYCCSFTDYKYKFRTVIIKKNGDVETFKGDFNEVLEYFDIKPLL